jgi:hypothetical protein
MDNIKSRIKLSDKVASQLPEFIRGEYPTFVAFVEAYYEFLENSNVDLVAIRDIDTSLDTFIQYFKKELAHNYPVNADKDKERFLLKHIKDQYLAKGSEASYKLLFRLLFGKEVYMDYPGKRMLRISDGRWKQDVALFVQVESGDPNVLIGKTIDVQTSKKIVRTELVKGAVSVSKITANVEQVTLFSKADNIWEIFLDRNFYGDVIPGDTIKFGSEFQGVILPCTSRVKIHQRGIGFRPGQVFQVSSGEGTPLWFKVLSIFDDGGLKTIDVIKFGIHYNTDFALTVLPSSAVSNRVKKQTTYDMTSSYQLTPEIIGTIEVIAGGQDYTLPPDVIIGGNGTGAAAHAVLTDGVVTSIVLDDQGEGYTNAFLTLQNKPGDTTGFGATAEPILGSIYDYSVYDKTEGFNEGGYINTGDYWDYDWSDGAYVGTIIRQFFTDASNTITDNPAILNVTLGAVAKYPGYYKTNDGFLDDSMFIQDSRYYQAFSYVLKIDEQLQSYASVVRTMLHPSGMAMFGEYSIQNIFALDIGFQALVKSLGVTLFDFVPTTDSNYLDIIKDLTSSIDELDDSVFIKVMSMELEQETVIADHEVMTYEFEKVSIETIIQEEEVIYDFNKGVDDEFGPYTVTNNGVRDDDVKYTIDKDIGSLGLDFTVPSDFETIYLEVNKYYEEATDGTAESGYLFKDPYDEGGYFEDLTYNAGLQQQF